MGPFPCFPSAHTNLKRCGKKSSRRWRREKSGYLSSVLGKPERVNDSVLKESSRGDSYWILISMFEPGYQNPIPCLMFDIKIQYESPLELSLSTGSFTLSGFRRMHDRYRDFSLRQRLDDFFPHRLRLMPFYGKHGKVPNGTSEGARNCLFFGVRLF